MIWENVKNLLSKKHRHNFDAYLETMKQLGYTNYYQVLNAKDYGIPQNRERVFTISVRKDINKSFEFPPKQELKLKLKDMLEDEVDERYYLSNKMVEYISADNEKWTGNNDKSIINKSVASTINTGEGSRRCDASNYISNQVEENFNLKGSSYLRDFGSKGKIQNKEYCDTLTASMGTGGGNVPIFQNNLRIRKLTPKECWRLMGFDDVDFKKAEKVNSNTQLYKQAGNSIVVNVLEAIFNNLLIDYKQDVKNENKNA